MKPALLRPQALRDRESEVRYYRRAAGSSVAVRLVKATREALNQIELNPGIGSPLLGQTLSIDGLKTWRVARFPLVWCYFERAEHVDVVRLLSSRQDLATILGVELGDE